jgi:hypothetical protein
MYGIEFSCKVFIILLIPIIGKKERALGLALRIDAEIQIVHPFEKSFQLMLAQHTDKYRVSILDCGEHVELLSS